MRECLRPGARAWLVVGFLWVVAMLNYLDRQMITNMRQSIVTDRALAATAGAQQARAARVQAEGTAAEWRNMTDAEFGLLSSAFLWIYGLLSPLAGFLADRFNRRRIIAGSLVVWSAVTWLTGHAHTFPQMLTARALMGVSEAFYIPAAVAMIVDHHRGPTRSLATGLHISGIYTGSILGGLGGWMATAWGWRFGFNAFGLVGIAYALLLFFTLPPAPAVAEGAAGGGRPAGRVRMGEAFAHLFAWRGFWLLLGMNALVGAAFWTIKNWLPTFFNTELHVPQSFAGLYSTSTFNAAAFVGMLAAGIAADRWSRTNARARCLVPAIAFCLAAPCFFGVGFSHAVPVILGGIVVAGLAQGALDSNLMPALCTLASPRYRATGYGLLNFVGTMTGGLLTYVGGLLKDAKVSFATQFKWGALLILLTGLLLWVIRPRPHIENGEAT